MEKKDPQGGAHYDDREIDARSIVRFAAALALITVAVLALTSVLRESLAETELAGHGAPAAIATELPTSPPEPRLQPQEHDALRAMRAREDEILGSYRWVDPDRGVAAIPVAEAIEILARRGLPSRPAASATSAASAVSLPTRSSLGLPADRRARGGPPLRRGGHP